MIIHFSSMIGIKLFSFFTLFLCLAAIAIPGKAQKQSIIVDSSIRLVDATVSPYNQIIPGDTLFFGAGIRDYLLIRNFSGESGKPVVFTNLNGVVIIDTDHHFGISMLNCRFIKFTGTGAINNFYGFKIQRVQNGGAMGIGGMSTDIEIAHFHIENSPIGGIYAKTDPDCSFISTRDKFTQYNTIIHDNQIVGVGNEGLYIGSTKYFGQIVNCNGADTLLLPSLLNGVKIYSNIISYTGWDGIQVSSASDNCQVFDNLITYDSQDDHFGQMSGILLGGGSKCDCFNNFIAEGRGNGIESHGIGGYRIFNNIIVNAGKTYKPGDSSQMKHGIYVTDVSVLPDSSFDILFNDIINPKSDGIRFASNHSRNNLVASNAIINPGNYDYYENGHTSFKGKDSYVMIPNDSSDVALKNNYFARTPDSAGFSPANYSLQPASPLIDAAYFDNKGVTFDFYHHERPYGSENDIGAHEYNPAFLDISENRAPSMVKITLYPNPVRESFSIRFEVALPSNVILNIYNLQGNLIAKDTWNIREAGINAKNVDVANLPAGIYLFILRVGNQQHSGRFVKISRR